MKDKGILKIKSRRAFLKGLALSKKRNFENNMKFVKLRALWLKRTSNKEWSERQKLIIDEVYKSNRFKVQQAKMKELWGKGNYGAWESS